MRECCEELRQHATYVRASRVDSASGRVPVNRLSLMSRVLQCAHPTPNSTTQHNTAHTINHTHRTQSIIHTAHNTTQHNTTQHSTQHNTTQHNTTQHNTTQHTLRTPHPTQHTPEPHTPHNTPQTPTPHTTQHNTYPTQQNTRCTQHNKTHTHTNTTQQARRHSDPCAQGALQDHSYR